MKSVRFFRTRPVGAGISRTLIAAASMWAGIAIGGEPGTDPEPTDQGKAELTAEQTASNGPARAKPRESWTSGASTSDPSPHDNAAPTPSEVHVPPVSEDTAASDSVQPVSSEEVDDLVSEAKDDPAEPTESWMRGNPAGKPSDERKPEKP